MHPFLYSFISLASKINEMSVVAELMPFQPPLQPKRDGELKREGRRERLGRFLNSKLLFW